MRKSKSAISFSFFFLSCRSLRDFYYPKQKKTREAFFWLVESQKKKNSRGGGKNTRPKTSTLSSLFTHTHLQSCLLLLNKSRPSPASRPPRSKYVRLVRFFAFPLWRLKTRSLSLSLSLLCPRRNAARDIRILDFAYHFFEIRKKIASRAMCIAWRFDGSNVHRSSSRRTKTRTSSSSRAIVLCADERTPSGRDRSSGKHTTRSMRESSAFGRRRSSLESFFDFLLFFSKTFSKFLYF